MKKIRKIMAAIDLSEFSPQVMEYAFGLAEDLKADLIAVNVINQRDVVAFQKVSEYLDDFSVEKYLKTLKEERSRLFRKVIKEADSRVDLCFSSTIQIDGEDNLGFFCPPRYGSNPHLTVSPCLFEGNAVTR